MVDNNVSRLVGMAMYLINPSQNAAVIVWINDLTDSNKRNMKYTELEGKIYVNESGFNVFQYYSDL